METTLKDCTNCKHFIPHAIYCAIGRSYNCEGAEWQAKDSTVKDVGPDQPVITNEQGGKQSDTPYCWIDLSPLAMLEIAARSGLGRKKYGDGNWWKITWQEHLNHAITHIYAWLAGDKSDNHPAAAGWRVIAALGVYLKEGQNKC